VIYTSECLVGCVVSRDPRYYCPYSSKKADEEKNHIDFKFDDIANHLQSFNNEYLRLSELA